MSRHGNKQHRPPKHGHKRKSGSSESKLALIMVLLGIMAIFALCLPLKYWVLMLSIALIAFGIVLLKN